MPGKGTAVLVIALLATAAFAAYEYTQVIDLNSRLADDDRAVALLNSTLSSRNESISELKSNITTLNNEIANLDVTIESLLANQTIDRTQLASLESQVTGLESSRALLNLELKLAGQTSGLFVRSYFINMTWTVAANTTQLMVSDVNGFNGTLVVLIGSGGPACLSAGSTGLNGTQGFGLLVGQGGAAGPSSIWVTVTPSPFQIYIDNVGTLTQSCVISALYVYQSTPTGPS